MPTSDEVIEACKVEFETIEYIKQVALRKLEPRPDVQSFRTQLINLPDYESFVDPYTSMRVLTMLLREYKVRRTMNVTKLQREPFFVRFETKALREETPLIVTSRHPLAKTPAYVRHREIKQFSTFNEQKIRMEA